ERPRPRLPGDGGVMASESTARVARRVVGSPRGPHLVPRDRRGPRLRRSAPLRSETAKRQASGPAVPSVRTPETGQYVVQRNAFSRTLARSPQRKSGSHTDNPIVSRVPGGHIL